MSIFSDSLIRHFANQEQQKMAKVQLETLLKKLVYQDQKYKNQKNGKYIPSILF